MKHPFRLIVILFMCFSCVACQTTPKTKPLAEMSDEERRAVYMYGPISPPKKEHSIAKTTFMVVGGTLLLIPLILVMSIATPGNQIHVGK